MNNQPSHKWFAKLRWQSVQNLEKTNRISELDEFADYEFDNGISIRVSTGDMAYTSKEFPYEMSIKDKKGRRSIPYLNRHGVIALMERLHEEQG